MNSLRDLITIPPDVFRNLAELARAIKNDILSRKDSAVIPQLRSQVESLFDYTLSDQGIADFCAQVATFSQFIGYNSGEGKIILKIGPNDELRMIATPFSEILQILFDAGGLPPFDTTMQDFFEKNAGPEVVFNPSQDPIIEFGDLITSVYEAFLEAYDERARDALGTYYTPGPAADFIVKSVDHLLRVQFSLPAGLMDSSTIVLDPASGTHVFLCSILRFLFAQLKEEEVDRTTPETVINGFLPRYHAYEFQPTAFAVGTFNVLQLIALFTMSRKESEIPLNFRVRDTLAYFEEDVAVVRRRREESSPIQVIWGNPPYKKDAKAGSAGLLDSLKEYQDPVRAEKSLRVLSDYYVKFLRHAHALVVEAGRGIVSFVMNNSFISGPVHRGLRACLLRDFSEIYVLDLHGSIQPPEVKPPNTIDENIFPIKTGVCILFLIRGGESDPPCHLVHFHECWGDRQAKLEFLRYNDLSSISWQALPAGQWGIEFNQFSLANVAPALIDAYVAGLSIRNLFREKVMGVTTGRDPMLVGFLREELLETVIEHRDELGVAPELSAVAIENSIIPYNYRPLDFRFLFNMPGVVNRDRHEVMQYIDGPLRVEGNLVIVTERFIRAMTAPHWNFIYATELIPDKSCISNQDNSHVYPLFVGGPDGRKVNVIAEVMAFLQRHYVRAVAGEDVFYYALGLLGTPRFQSQFSDLLMLDYPRVLFPKDDEHFQAISSLGMQLSSTYLLSEGSPGTHFGRESENKEQGNLTYQVESVTYDATTSRVWYNGEEFLEVEPEVWEAHIGYFPPVPDYLAHRCGRALSPAEVDHVDRLIYNLERMRGIQSQLDEIFQDLPQFLDCRELLQDIIRSEIKRLKLNRGILFPLPFAKTYRKLSARLYVPDEQVVRQTLQYD